MTRHIGWNDQRNNIDYGKAFKASWQCFSTSVWMAMSNYTDKIDALDDKGLASYLDDVEMSIGGTGIAEVIIAKKKMDLHEHSSFWWTIQQAGMEKWLHSFGVKGNALFHDGTFPIYSLPSILKTDPVILATNHLGGLPGGHIILLVDWDEKQKGFVVNDPYGNAYSKYTIRNGAGIIYGMEWLTQSIAMDPLKAKCRCMYWNK